MPRTQYVPVRGAVPGPGRATAGGVSAGRVPAPLARLPLVFTRPPGALAREGGRHPAGPAVPGNASPGPGFPRPAAGHRPSASSSTTSATASSSPVASPLTASDVPQLVERVVREIDRRMQARLERRGRP
ncbi:hypothetical protein [Streptomyces sp. NPDC000410]|uniref:hypothetical protein n=1 Tax=Streptomyces sp. NPDC000410 TaxID=3154254 RepID=UPI00332E3801